MINNVYQLVSPKTIVVKFEDMITEGKVLIRPRYMALCHADQRYFQGRRDPRVMRQKLPMALIHECMGEVVSDASGTFSLGENVVMIPNVAGRADEGLYENYSEGSGFLSSGRDGFMRELVNLCPDRVVSCTGIDSRVAAITEFVSVTAHAASRFEAAAHPRKERIAIIGDGSLAYVMACMLSALYPLSALIVVGRNQEKLNLFSFVSERYLTDALPDDLHFDHAFECAGGEGSMAAIDTVISRINPQGVLMLLGVSEQSVPIFTRNVLEKGMTLIGCSRSGRKDFETALSVMRKSDIQQRLKQIIFVDAPVRDVKDIKRAFATDLQTPFKTVFGWDM
ncbi:MAG: alcohol dehydrogenase catalytic domain-containing protein [Raoultibacter sp.]